MKGSELGGDERGGLPIQVSPFLTLSPLLPHPTQHYKTPLSPRQPVSPLQPVPKIELSLAQLNTNYRLAKPQITGLYFAPSTHFAFQMQPYP